MMTLRQSIFLPVFALIVFLGFGAGTALANSSNEGVGGWSSEAVGPGQVSIGATGNLSGIDGSGDARFTSQATGNEPKRRAFVGKLGATRTPATEGASGTFVETSFIDSISVTLQTSGGEETKVISLPGDRLEVSADGTVDSEFVRTPGGPRAGTLTDGAQVVVLTEETEGGGLEAVWVLVKPIKPNVPVNGVVVEVDGDEVTVETSNGEKKTVTLPEHARGVGPGEVITVFQDNSGKAKGLVRAQEVKNRLKKFLDDAEEDVDEPEEDEEGQGNKHDKAAAHAERIANFLTRFNERQTRLLDRVIGGAPDSVKAKLVQVRERIQAQRLEHREAIERIRAKLDRVHPEHSHRGGNETTDRVRPDNSDRGRPEGAGQARPERADQDPDGEPPTADNCRGRSRGRGQDGCTDTPTP
jgi:hypothetical protein